MHSSAKSSAFKFQLSAFRSLTTWADITKARRLLGWAPQITTEAGFRKAVDWHVANREWLGRIDL